MQEIPSVEFPLHTLIELTPKPDGKMSEHHIRFDIRNKRHLEVKLCFLPSTHNDLSSNLPHQYADFHEFVLSALKPIESAFEICQSRKKIK